MTSVMIFVIKHWRYLAGAAVLAFAGLMVHAYGRSACDINRHHVKDVLVTRSVKYRGWF